MKVIFWPILTLSIIALFWTFLVAAKFGVYPTPWEPSWLAAMVLLSIAWAASTLLDERRNQ